MLVPAFLRRAKRRENKINWDYQLQIANMHASPEKFTYCDRYSGEPVTEFDTSLVGRALTAIKGEPQPNHEQLNVTEWLYGGVYFDGFWREQCTVVDAKGRYAQFLSSDDGMPKLGFPQRMVFPGLIEEAGRQIMAINTAAPQAKLQWHFMEPEVYLWASSKVPQPIVCIHTPFTIRHIEA